MLLILTVVFCVFGMKAEAANIDPAVKSEVVAAIKRIEKEGLQEYELIKLWKESGASYLRELTAPTDKADSYVNAEVQRMMVGVYLMDMNYAQTFGRYNDAKKFAEALDILFGKLGFRNRELQLCCQEIMDNVQDQDKDKLYRKLDEVIDRIWVDYVNTEKGLDLTIDGLYGWILEGLYLSGEITAQQDYDPVFMSYLNKQMHYFKKMKDTLKIFKKGSALAEMVEQSERLQIIQEVIDQLGADRNITSRDVLANRRLIARERADIIQ